MPTTPSISSQISVLMVYRGPFRFSLPAKLEIHQGFIMFYATCYHFQFHRLMRDDSLRQAEHASAEYSALLTGTVKCCLTGLIQYHFGKDQVALSRGHFPSSKSILYTTNIAHVNAVHTCERMRHGRCRERSAGRFLSRPVRKRRFTFYCVTRAPPLNKTSLLEHTYNV